MHPRLGFSAVGAATLLLALASASAAGTSAPSASGSGPQSRAAATHQGAHPLEARTGPPLARACYQQLDNDNGVAIVSQNFERASDIYDSRAADDFRLRTRCKVSKVVVNGSYSLGVGPAESMHVTIYRDNDGRVGGIIDTQNHLAYRDESGAGNFTVTLAARVDLRPGSYWISVKANLDFATGGQWGWNTNNRQVGKPSQWANPNDGFGTGCTRYTATARCIPSGQGPDFSFALFD